jgi:hypothetical protein
MSLASVKIRGSDGIVRELPPGRIFIPKNPDIIKPLMVRGLIKVVQDASVIMKAACDEVVAGGRWTPSPETRQAEAEIEAAQHKGNIIDFALACERWKRAGIK